ncbi:MAG TPA: hypothetical protein VEC19_20360 [Usitatibacter sp.]|nr:hypothetical protein [Usitatibacter sp.]
MRALCLATLVFLAATSPLLAASPQVSGGLSHTVAVAADGTTRVWGSDSLGQLGLGRSLYSTVPLRVNGVSGVRKVAVGGEPLVFGTYFDDYTGGGFTLALTQEGDVYSWGANREGELGDGTTSSRPDPRRIAALAGVTAISAGWTGAAAVKADGTVWTWGDSPGAFLGHGPAPPRGTVTRVPGVENIVAVSMGCFHTVALAADRTVWAWGWNGYGALGLGSITTGDHPPTQLGAPRDIVAIAAGCVHTLALTANGDVWAWGSNAYGQLGDGTRITRAEPVRLNGISDVVAISTRVGHTLALKRDGTLWSWGRNDYGELGDGTTTARLAPVLLSGVPRTLEAIAAGNGFSLALQNDGTVLSWGGNEDGRLGDSTLASHSTPQALPGFAAVRSLEAGPTHAAAVKQDGSVWGWGANRGGQLALEAPTQRSTPTAGPVNGTKSLSAGQFHTAAVKDDGTVWTWGWNRWGQLGDGTIADRSTPARVSGVADVKSVAAGSLDTIALLNDGTVFEWGFRAGPRALRVADLTSVVAIAAGRDHGLALRSDGSVWAWGSNDMLQLGTGSNVASRIPVQVSALADIVAIAAGRFHNLALKRDGSVWAWGSDEFGQVGDGSGNFLRAAPVAVPGLSGIVAIAAGGYHSLALNANGLIMAWGANSDGQLGDGSTTARTSPVPATTLPRLAAIAGGTFHSIGLRGDGIVLGWGRNSYGQLGDGTIAQRARSVMTLRENGAGSIAAANWFLDLDPAAPNEVPTDKIPVFLLVATGDTGTASADVRFRAQDVGTTGSVYVFAMAPATQVQGGLADAALKVGHAKDERKVETPIGCVLAQLNAAGQMVAVTSANLGAYLTGLLAAQGASVNILNGVPLSNVSGATFFVGYGTSPGAMINNGINRAVVTVPGSLACQPAAPQTGWWWNPQEDGRGYSIEKHANNLFFAAFLYDVSGRSTWHVSSGPVSLEGSLYNGDLLAASGGQTLGGPYQRFPALASAGTMTMTFNNESTGTLVWPGGTVPIQRFNIVPNGLTAPAVAGRPESGWWWNEAEPGRGFFMEWQGGTLDIAGYMYDETGNPVWYLTVGEIGGTPTARTFSGSWWSYTGGQTLTGPWRQNTRSNSNVAPVTITFGGPDTAIMTLPNNRTTNLRRHRF